MIDIRKICISIYKISWGRVTFTENCQISSEVLSFLFCRTSGQKPYISTLPGDVSDNAKYFRA